MYGYCESLSDIPFQHKHLRENSWKLPPMSYLHALSPMHGSTSLAPGEEQQDAADAISIEFEQQWENTSDLNEDDMRQNSEDYSLWWGCPTARNQNTLKLVQST